jgi:hypothetical protein
MADIRYPKRVARKPPLGPILDTGETV